MCGHYPPARQLAHQPPPNTALEMQFFFATDSVKLPSCPSAVALALPSASLFLKNEKNFFKQFSNSFFKKILKLLKTFLKIDMFYKNVQNKNKNENLCF